MWFEKANRDACGYVPSALYCLHSYLMDFGLRCLCRFFICHLVLKLVTKIFSHFEVPDFQSSTFPHTLAYKSEIGSNYSSTCQKPFPSNTK